MCKYWIRLSPFCIDWQRTMFVYWKLVVKISFSKTVYFLFHHSNLIHWSKNLIVHGRCTDHPTGLLSDWTKFRNQNFFEKIQTFYFFFLDESLWLAGFRTGGQCGRRTQNTATWKKWWEIFMLMTWKNSQTRTRMSILLAQYSLYPVLV